MVANWTEAETQVLSIGDRNVQSESLDRAQTNSVIYEKISGELEKLQLQDLAAVQKQGQKLDPAVQNDNLVLCMVVLYWLEFELMFGSVDGNNVN